jgi:energy-converting hydrogenase Eha subunit E
MGAILINVGAIVASIGSTSRRPKPMIHILDIAIKTCCESISLSNQAGNEVI